MDPGTRFSKTDAGRAEVAERRAGLSPVQRRVLIVVDGNKTLAELGALVRPGELPDAIAQLHRLGLIDAPGEPVPMLAPAAPGYAAVAPGEAPRPATSPELFAKVRQDASDFVRERLGGAGEPICTAIERCDSPEALRKMLRGVEIFVGQRLDAQTTQSFARYFGQLLL